MGDDLDWRERNCLCDELCRKYGDCCLDSPRFEFSEQRRGMASFQCVDLRQFGGVYMKTSCPPEWSEMKTKYACETASLTDADPLSAVPATSPITGITYRNIYCAVCHKEEDLDVWHARLECPDLPTHTLTRQNISSLLSYSEEEESWGISFNEQFYSCSVDPVIPETANHLVRRCVPSIVKTCAVNWTNIEVRSRCEAYTSLVYQGDNVYRNPHCAMCNNIPLQYLGCSQLTFRTNIGKDFSLAAFSMLLDWTGMSPGKTEPCEENLLYDHFFKKCRSLLIGVQDPQETNQSSHSHPTPQTMPAYAEINYANSSKHFLNCQKFIMEKDEYILRNNSAYVPIYEKTFGKGEFNITENGKMVICVDSIGVKQVNKFDVYMGYVTFAGLGVSIIFLGLHLTAFCLVSELRNLSGKNLASLCVALLIAYISFMAGQVFIGAPCFVLAVITFYAFLASFTWMLTMSFDVWRTLRLATAELRVSAGKQWRKFIVYSIWSWVAPGLIVGAAIWTELSPIVSPDWRPDFAVNSCWFGKSKPLLFFFAAPLGLIMLLNISFFASSAHMIYSTTSTTRFTASAGTQRDFRLYVRLAVVMGLTWTMGLIAGTLDLDVLWYVFIALNTLQGLFIFLAFTCTDKVIRGLAVRHADDKPLRPPSFSWSSDSTRKSQVGSDQTSDTLY